MNRRLSRRQALRRLAGTAAAPSVWSVLSGITRAGAAGRRPNILFIMTDDHAAHALSCYGSRINKTPNLDRIAAGGMRFDNCFVTNALCGPSRATLLTGQYSHIHGYKINAGRFDGSRQTFPKLLQQAGYHTAIIGKWHLNSDPTGFDHWCILPGQGVYVNPGFIDNGKRRTIEGYVTDIITDLAIEHLKARDKSKPFCLLYHHKAPHRAWNPAPRHASLYEDADIPLPETFDDDYSHRGRAAREQEMTVEKHLGRSDLKADPPAGLSGPELKKWKYQRYIKDYLRCVAGVDENIGRMLDFLDKEGLTDDTVVIYTSDNGFFLGDHGWYDKRFMYEHSLRVPFIVRYPPLVKAGSVSREIVINCDWAPTLLDCAGVAVPPEMQGRSLRPLLAGQTPADWRKSMYYHYYEFPQPHHVYPHYGVRTQRHKLIHFYTLNEWELFDLEKDPNEMRSVYDDPAYATVREELKAELQRLRTELKDTTP